MSPSPQIESARAIAERAHAGQRDQIGVPYIEHPAAVAVLVRALPEFASADDQMQQDVVAAAWLHDVVEDTPETAETLSRQGMSDRTVQAVVALTRTAEVPPEDYYATIKELPVALMVKTADIAHNLAPERNEKLDEAQRQWFTEKYAKALHQLGVAPAVVEALHQSRRVR